MVGDGVKEGGKEQLSRRWEEVEGRWGEGRGVLSIPLRWEKERSLSARVSTNYL